MARKPPSRHDPARHKRESQRAYDQRRGSARERGYDTQWDKFSAALRADPYSVGFWCHDCKAEGIDMPAEQIHHIEKLSVAPERKYDLTNLMGLCEMHHSQRTARGE